MNLSVSAKTRIRGLIYPVQFDADPHSGIDRVIEQVILRGALSSSPDEFIAAIDEALRSDTVLADLIPQTHAESTIRSYLLALRERLYTLGVSKHSPDGA